MLNFCHENLLKNLLILFTHPKYAKNTSNMPNMPKCLIKILDAKRFQNMLKFCHLA